MPYEEDKLAAIAQASVEMDASEATRHARYEAEDKQTAVVRAHEDALHAEGVTQREALKSSLEAAITKRQFEEKEMSPEAIQALMLRIATLEQADEDKKAAEAKAAEKPAS